MIIHKDTKSIETLDGFPDSNFGNYENVFVLDDESELAKRVRGHDPYFSFILDDAGELIDIELTERPPDPIRPKTQLDLLQEKYDTLQGAVDFIITDF